MDRTGRKGIGFKSVFAARGPGGFCDEMNVAR